MRSVSVRKLLLGLAIVVFIGGLLVVTAYEFLRERPKPPSVALAEDYSVVYAGRQSAGNGDRDFKLGEECWVQNGGTLTNLCENPDGVLARYDRPRDDAFGGLCPVGSTVFIERWVWLRLQDEKAWQTRIRSAIERLNYGCPD